MKWWRVRRPSVRRRSVSFLKCVGPPKFKLYWAPNAALQSSNVFIPLSASVDAARLCISSSEDCDIERCDVDSSNPFGDLDIYIRMMQRSNSSGVLAKQGFDCLIIKSLHGARQAGETWGNKIHSRLKQCNYIQWTFDPRMYYFVYKGDFIIICVVKQNMAAAFDVKFYGYLKYFIRWTITQSLSAMYVNQTAYCEPLLHWFEMFNFHAVKTPFPNAVALSAPHRHETPLSYTVHHTYLALLVVFRTLRIALDLIFHFPLLHLLAVFMHLPLYILH